MLNGLCMCGMAIELETFSCPITPQCPNANASGTVSDGRAFHFVRFKFG